MYQIIQVNWMDNLEYALIDIEHGKLFSHKPEGPIHWKSSISTLIDAVDFNIYISNEKAEEWLHQINAKVLIEVETLSKFYNLPSTHPEYFI